MDKKYNFALTELSVEDMKKKLRMTGGLFYQYRGCQMNQSIIYDIENIKNGVVFSRTPLMMNDPFDSQVAFSVEQIYKESISMLLDSLDFPKEKKMLLELILVHRILGTLVTIVEDIKKVKIYFINQRIVLKKTQTPLNLFITQKLKYLYDKAPKSVKTRFNKDMFESVANLIVALGDVEITEEEIVATLKIDELLSKFKDGIISIQSNIYEPKFREFLSKLTISCFTASGWDNELMWSHYSNSYYGICLEYDMNNYAGNQGLFYPVQYKKQRALISLKDMGLNSLKTTKLADGKNKINFNQGEPNILNIMNYLLVKHDCWAYENEWRLINVGNAFEAKISKFPYLKSVTLGIRVEPILRRILLDICRLREIQCYQLTLNSEEFKLERILIKEEDPFNEELELKYIAEVLENVTKNANDASLAFSEWKKLVNQGQYNLSYIKEFLKNSGEMLVNTYFCKYSLNKLCENVESIKEKEGFNELKLIKPAIDKYLETCITHIIASSGVYDELYEQHNIVKSDYDAIKNEIQSISDVVSKIKSIEWNELLGNDN